MKIDPNALKSCAGLGLRTQHITDILVSDVDVSWFELLADNWLSDGGLTQHYLDAFVERYPLTLHGVGLSLGGPEPLDLNYLQQIKSLMRRSDALWYSDHLCFCRLGANHVAHDLLPLPYTEEAIHHVSQRIRQTQDYLETTILIENVSSYIEYQDSQMTESEFLRAVIDESQCHLLLDVNNIYVSQRNHGHSGESYLKDLAGCPVKEIHLAGFEDKGTHVVDAHNHPVCEDVWNLYEEALKIFGPSPTLIEWDNELPTFERLHEEAQKAQQRLDRLESLDCITG